MLNNTLMIVNSKLLWPNLSMSDGFRGKHKVSTYSHLSIEVGREDITNLLFEAEGLYQDLGISKEPVKSFVGMFRKMKISLYDN